VSNGGILTPAFQDLIDFLSPAQLAVVLTQLSGELGTAVAPAAIQNMNSFLSLLGNTWSDVGRGPGIVTVPHNTVKALGYADDRAPPAFASFDQASGASEPRLWDMWGAVFGGQNDTEGDPSVGSHDRWIRNWGIASGFDRWINPDTRFGLAVSGGQTDFGLSDDLGTGHSDSLQVAIHARTNISQFYLAGALAYGWNSVTTDREVIVPVIVPDLSEHLTASFSGHDVAGQIEAGYRLGWFIPYAALRGQAFFTPAYTETGVGQSADDFALHYDANTTLTARTEIGARIEGTVPMDDGSALTLRGRLAWAHDFWSDNTMTAGFPSLIGSPNFTVQGATPASDSLLVSAGAEFRLGNGFGIGGWFDGEFADGSQTYSGTGRVSYAW